MLLHGLLDTSEGWNAPMRRCEREAFAFDLPGFGDSSLAPHATVRCYAELIAEAIEELGLERFELVGHSLGGATAAVLASLMPERVTQLVLWAPAGFGPLFAARLADHAIGQIATNFTPFVLASKQLTAAVYAAFVANGRRPDPELSDRLRAQARRCLPGAKMGLRAVARVSCSGGELRRLEHAYRGPVIALWGGRDHLVPPSHRHGVAEAFPQAQLVVWESMGHHPQRERTREAALLLGGLAPEPSAA